MRCRACGGDRPLYGDHCDSCILEKWIEGARQVRAEMIELFRSELNEPTEAIWQRITK